MFVSFIVLDFEKHSYCIFVNTYIVCPGEASCTPLCKSQRGHAEIVPPLSERQHKIRYDKKMFICPTMGKLPCCNSGVQMLKIQQVQFILAHSLGI